jgi:hypothetical protein
MSDQASYSDQVYDLQRDLHLLATANAITFVEQSCSLAAQICIYTLLCDMSFNSRAVEAAVDELIGCAKRVATNEHLFPGLKEILDYQNVFWFLAVTWVASDGHQHQVFAVRAMKVVSGWIDNDSGIRERILDDILWNIKWKAFLPKLWKELDD